MPAKRELDLGTGFVVATILFTALSNWDTFINHLPVGARPYVQSPLTAIILALGGVYFLWRAASHSVALSAAADEALRIANESNRELQRRVEAAEAKLTKALDDAVIDWSPAYQSLLKGSEKRLEQQAGESIFKIAEAYNGFRRRAALGFLGGDDISKAPPPATPHDVTVPDPSSDGPEAA
jgi:hypothetical protein